MKLNWLYHCLCMFWIGQYTQTKEQIVYSYFETKTSRLDLANVDL